MDKGCGCLGFALAVTVGVFLGLAGLGIAGYVWLNTRVLSDQPAKIDRPKWTKIDEGLFAVKLAPVYLAIKQEKESLHTVNIKPKEANRLWDECVAPYLEESVADVSFGDTAAVIAFSQRATQDKYLNGEIRLNVSGENGEFEVKIYSLKTGDWVWPRSFLPWAAYYLRSRVERQPDCANRPARLLGLYHDKKGLKATIKVMEKSEGGR